MNRDLFKNKLVDFCESAGLCVSNDRRLVYYKKNLSYDLFFFSGDKDYFEMKMNQELYPLCIEKCFNWSEESLFNCMEKAKYWIQRNKLKQIEKRINNIQKDF